MKKTLFILAAAALTAQAFAFDSEASLKPVGTVGEYTKTEYQITEKFGDYYRSPRAKFVHTFDSTGREIEASELTSKDALVDHITYKYDGDKLVETVCTDSDGKVSWKITASYDADGNKTEESEFNSSDVLTNKTIWRVNGKQTDESYYNADGALLSKIITKYDDQNRVVEIAQYAAQGHLEEKSSYSYNDAGKLSEIAYSNAVGAPSKKVVYRFDASYQITEEQTYNADNKLIVRVIYKYDSTGNIIKTTTYNVADKFGTTVNELSGISEYSYSATARSTPAAATAPRTSTSDAK
ncbi:MAG: hypothetical protein J6I53_03280 [Treponema sp.]|uniref:hypothetical protein n=1 Tax=Treponema sp. TaxID=166 RepID=UPI001B67AED6|nr:hypothetical protein [Treponema sp.]MBP3771700.1 hypothetical protein [Treponema sp.]MBQ9282967.1 hypothetical protein [Treponema sp.]